MEVDPVIARRRQIAGAVAMAKRAGYAALLASVAAFGIGVVADFTRAVTTAVTVLLAVSSVLLLPAIILGYAVAKAEREDPGPERPSERGGRPRLRR